VSTYYHRAPVLRVHQPQSDYRGLKKHIGAIRRGVESDLTTKPEDPPIKSTDCTPKGHFKSLSRRTSFDDAFSIASRSSRASLPPSSASKPSFLNQPERTVTRQARDVTFAEMDSDDWESEVHHTTKSRAMPSNSKAKSADQPTPASNRVIRSTDCTPKGHFRSLSRRTSFDDAFSNASRSSRASLPPSSSGKPSVLDEPERAVTREARDVTLVKMNDWEPEVHHHATKSRAMPSNSKTFSKRSLASRVAKRSKNTSYSCAFRHLLRLFPILTPHSHKRTGCLQSPLPTALPKGTNILHGAGCRA
jgi:hypothetical protein